MYVSGVPLASRGLRVSVRYFAWQARDFLLCKGRDVRLWRPSGVPWSPSAPLCSILRGRRAAFCSARGVYVSGVPLASRGLRASVLDFAWQARDFLLCKGRDVLLWRPSGVPWSPHLCGLFCVAGARLSALQGA